ncbi:MAG TPA: hypothetical protein VFX76_20990 [Roseiflexaceae bacterium]|nr:hypothetical protein [Roseiflexaceae bacterium]
MRLAVVFSDITDRKRREVNLACFAKVGQDLVRLTNFGEAPTPGVGHPSHRSQRGQPAVQG